MDWVRTITVATAFGLAAVSRAQLPTDDRPAVLDTAPKTKDDVARQKAERARRDARALFGAGVLERRQDRALLAMDLLERARQLDPGSLEVHRELAPLYLMLGREQDALQACRFVLDRDPRDLDTAIGYARLLKIDGRTSDAIAALQKAVGGRKAGDRPDRLLVALNDLTEFLELKGDAAAMAAAQERAIQTMEGSKDDLLFGNGILREQYDAALGRAYERLGKARAQTKDYARAATAYRKAREVFLQSEDGNVRRQAVRVAWNAAEMAYLQGDWAKALVAVDAYLQNGPVETEPYARKAELLRKLGRDAEVIPALQQHAAREEFNIGVQLLYAKELSAEPARHDEAEELYRKLLKTNVKPEVYRGLFRLYHGTKQYDLILAQYEAVVKVIQAKEGAASADDREAAGERARAMFVALRREPAVVTGLLAATLPNPQAATQWSYRTSELLAALAARTNRLAQARGHYEVALQSAGPEQEQAIQAGLLDVMRLQRDNKAIVDVCEKALANPLRGTWPAIFHVYLSMAQTDLGNYGPALKHIDEAIKLSSDDAKVNRRCQKANILARDGKGAEAVRECEAVLKEFPDRTSAQRVRIALSAIYELLGDHKKSEEQLRLVLELNPEMALAHNNLGYQLADQNRDLDEAERLIRRAIELDARARKDMDVDGENAAYLDSLGWLLFRRGKYAEAREQLEKAAGLPEGSIDATVWDHLGDTYARLGLTAEARKAWARAKQYYTETPRRKGDPAPGEMARKLATLPQP